MKFGKRLAAEAERRWLPHYVDYKGLKHALYADISAHDGAGPAFAACLAAELAKVGAFYAAREAELGAALEAALEAPAPDAAAVAELRAELQHLRKFAVLNYIAVVKAVKKRNRRLAEAVGGRAAAPPLKAVSILAEQHFFTSLRLAGLLTRAEIAAGAAAGTSTAAAPGPKDDVYERYTCPICLDLLRSPVVLSCAHAACWGCLMAHCSAVSAGAARGGHAAGAEGFKAPKTPTASVDRPAVWDADAEAAPGAAAAEDATVATFGCPLCRKDQLMDLERLQVDPHLSAFVDRLAAQKGRPAEPQILRLPKPAAAPIPIRAAAAPAPACQADDPMAASSGDSQRSALAAAAAGAPPPLPPAAPPALLPPQLPRHRGRLTVCLDIDGTLVTTFTPARAPRLPPSMATYVVGKGGRLNPGGVFVVERPGLGEFLRRLGAFAEVVIFTAGLEDYAAPICDAFEARYPGTVVHRLYRPATVHADVYPCVKDLARLGRDLRRCVLLDDTPLAFFHQPDHGVPILPFKGDADDRLLLEAVAPLLEALAGEGDVAPLLARRFNMRRWFAAQGLTPGRGAPAPKAPAPKPKPKALHRAPSSPAALHNAPAAAVVNAPGGGAPPPLLVLDWDKTCVGWDTGERLCDELAPELTSLLSLPADDPTASYLPVTNTVLAEMQRRGVTPAAMTAALRGMAAEVPPATGRMLRGAAARGATPVILSDANSAVIGAVLAAAKLKTAVADVITNPAEFESLEEGGASGASGEEVEDGAGAGGGWFFRRRRAVAPAFDREPAQRLVVRPRHAEPHGCPLCPTNLCKGRELDALRAAAGPARRVVYAGDGANDLCPALCLGSGDVVLAREGHPLAALLAARGGDVAARVRTWADHDQLAALVDEETACYC